MFTHDIRVRYAEVDQQRVVFNAHYLTWVDDAMSAWLEAVGYRGASWAQPGDQPAGEQGWDFMVRHAEVDFRGSAAFGDRVAIDCEVARWGTSSFDVAFDIRVGERHLVAAVLTYVGIRNLPDGTWEKAAVPSRFRSLLGEPVPAPQ